MGTSPAREGDPPVRMGWRTSPSPVRDGNLWVRGGDRDITGKGWGPVGKGWGWEPTSEDGVGDVTGKGWGWGHHR